MRAGTSVSQRDYEDRTNKERVHWDQERAEHIGWIHLALTDPTKVRWNHQNLRNQAYLLGFPSNILFQANQALLCCSGTEKPEKGRVPHCISNLSEVLG